MQKEIAEIEQMFLTDFQRKSPESKPPAKFAKKPTRKTPSKSPLRGTVEKLPKSDNTLNKTPKSHRLTKSGASSNKKISKLTKRTKSPLSQNLFKNQAAIHVINQKKKQNTPQKRSKRDHSYIYSQICKDYKMDVSPNQNYNSTSIDDLYGSLNTYTIDSTTASNRNQPTLRSSQSVDRFHAHSHRKRNTQPTRYNVHFTEQNKSSTNTNKPHSLRSTSTKCSHKTNTTNTTNTNININTNTDILNVSNPNTIPIPHPQPTIPSNNTSYYMYYQHPPPPHQRSLSQTSRSSHSANTIHQHSNLPYRHTPTPTKFKNQNNHTDNKLNTNLDSSQRVNPKLKDHQVTTPGVVRSAQGLATPSPNISQ